MGDEVLKGLVRNRLGHASKFVACIDLRSLSLESALHVHPQRHQLRAMPGSRYAGACWSQRAEALKHAVAV